MAVRMLLGRHPNSGTVGFWVSKPGFDVLTDDRTDRKKFQTSTDFAGKPFRIVKAGIVNTGTDIFLPSSYANLGGEPFIQFRPMVNSTTERAQGIYGVQDSNATASGSEYTTRFFDGNPAKFVVYVTASSRVDMIRYVIGLI
jgi:hypothetical protein